MIEIKSEGRDLSVRQKLDVIFKRLNERKDSETVFVKLYPETARAEADAADQRAARGEALGPLDGKIVSIKDLFDVARCKHHACRIHADNNHILAAAAVLHPDEPVLHLSQSQKDQE